MRREKVFVVVPAFNESGVILKTVKSLYAFADKIIVVDDGSTDGTNKIKFGRKVIYLRHTVNLGQGAALMTGLTCAKMFNPDFVVTFDADGQLDPRDIPRALSLIEKMKADVCLGSRFLGKAVNIPFGKLITLKAAIIFTNFFSGIRLTDTHNGFRVLNKKSLGLISITQNRMAHASEFIEQIRENQLKYIETPVTVKYTNYSKSKGQSLGNSVRILADLLTEKFV